MLTVQNARVPGTARARILYDLELEVGRGEVVALMGRNGAGKSTTMKAIMGLVAQAQGRSALQRRGYFAAASLSRSRASVWASLRKTAAFSSI